MALIASVEGSELYFCNTEGNRNSVVSQASCRMDVTWLEQYAYLKIAELWMRNAWECSLWYSFWWCLILNWFPIIMGSKKWKRKCREWLIIVEFAIFGSETPEFIPFYVSEKTGIVWKIQLTLSSFLPFGKVNNKEVICTNNKKRSQ